jgi:hypothetical protein
MWVWIVADTAIIVSFSYTLSLGRPRATLSPHRPTAEPLGLQTVAAVCLMLAIDTLFLFFAVAMLFNQVCAGSAALRCRVFRISI